jgi:membrane protease YdiL (CAAX protease family)
LERKKISVRNTAISVLIILFLYTLLHFAVEKFLAGKVPLGQKLLLISGITLVLVGIFQIKGERISFFYGYRDKEKGKNFSGGWLLASGMACAGTLILYFNKNIFWQDINPFVNALPYIAVMLPVAMAEEALFRGYILRRLQTIIKPVHALVLSSMIFAIFHGFNPGVSFMALINILLAGWLLGTLYLKSSSLYMPVAFHFAWNAMLGPVLGFPVSGIKLPAILETEARGNILLSGGSFGFEASLVCTVLLLAISALAYLRWLYEKKI